MKGDKYAMRQKKQLLLPHGISIKAKAVTGDDDRPLSSSTSNVAPALKILSHEEVKDILHSNMLCAPAPRSEDIEQQEEGCYVGDSTILTQTKHIGVGRGRDTGVSLSMTQSSAASVSKGSATGKSFSNDTDRLKSVTMDANSSLAGDSLDNVTDELQLWLTRLADACPLDENEDMWKTRKRLAASESLHTHSLQKERDNRYDSDNCEDECDPSGDIDGGTTSQERDKSPHHAMPTSPTTTVFLSKKQPMIMNTVYSQSEKYLRNITENGETSELDNVIQRLAMVRKKAPSKAHASSEKFEFTVSGPVPLLSISTTSSLLRNSNNNN
jgi:hypothetical protein